MLQYLLNSQETLNSKIIDEWLSKEVITREKLNDWTLKFTRALIHEAVELEDSVNWKWWKKQDIDIENAKIELIDMLHFLLSLFLLYDMNAEDIVALYDKKNKLNHKRQEQGYKTGEYQKYKEINGKIVEDNVECYASQMY